MKGKSLVNKSLKVRWLDLGCVHFSSSCLAITPATVDSA